MNEYPTYTFDRLASSNTTLWRLAEEGAVHGTAVIALEQSAGRGRLGKSWLGTGDKGLYCSILVRPRLSPETYPQLTLASGLAVALALEALTGLSCQLKWPNDVYVCGRKCGGILTEASPGSREEQKRFAVIGVGLNVNAEAEDFSAELIDKATSLFLQSGKVYDRSVVFEQVRRAILEQVERLVAQGLGSILTDWRERDFLLGKETTWLACDGKIVTGIALGPDDQGQLQVRDRQGNVHAVLSGDVRLAAKGESPR